MRELINALNVLQLELSTRTIFENKASLLVIVCLWIFMLEPADRSIQ